MDSSDLSPTKKQNHTFYSEDDSGKYSQTPFQTFLAFLKEHAHLLFRTTSQAHGSGKTMSILIISNWNNFYSQT